MFIYLYIYSTNNYIYIYTIYIIYSQYVVHYKTQPNFIAFNIILYRYFKYIDIKKIYNYFLLRFNILVLWVVNKYSYNIYNNAIILLMYYKNSY